MTSVRTRGVDGGSVSLTAHHEQQQQQAPARETKPSISELRGFEARVCLASDSARLGVLESQGTKGWWAARIADKGRNILSTDLKLLSSDAASFEPSQAPLSAAERQVSMSEYSKRGLSVAASTTSALSVQSL